MAEAHVRDWWHEEGGKESTVIPSVEAVAVYTNTHGDIIIRQQDSMGGEDSYVHIPRSMATVVINALKAELARERLTSE